MGKSDAIGIHISFPTMYSNDIERRVSTLYEICDYISYWCELIASRKPLEVYLVIRQGPPLYLAKRLIEAGIMVKGIIPYKGNLRAYFSGDELDIVNQISSSIIEDQVSTYCNLLIEELLGHKKSMVLLISRGTKRLEQKIISKSCLDKRIIDALGKKGEW